MQSLTIIAEVADGIGMFGFAVAGLFASAGRRIDPVGVFVSVFTTAFGGGAFSSGPMPSGSPSLPSAAAQRATGWATP